MCAIERTSRPFVCVEAGRSFDSSSKSTIRFLPRAFAVIIAASAQATSSRGFIACSGSLRDSDRDRHGSGLVELGRGELLGQPLRQLESVGGVARRHDHAELLAAQAADDVGDPERRPEQLRELDEHLVAGPVPVHVVHALEVVDVEHEHGDRVVRAARARQLGAQALVEVAVVVEAGQRVRLRLVLEPRADLRVVERERRGVGEALGELELLVAEGCVLAEPVDVEHALDDVAGDQRHGDQRLGLVGRRSGDRLRARVEVSLVRSHRLAVLGRPAGDALAELRAAVHDLLRPLVAREHRDEHGLRLVGLVDAERVVRDELGERVGDSLEQGVQALLREDVVEDVGEPAVRLDERLPGGSAAVGALGRVHG